MPPSAPTSRDLIEALTQSNASITPNLAQELLTAAIQIKPKAYCPYSKFRVGAAILALPIIEDSFTSPKIFTGVNVENASYPVGTCAERCAISTAVAAGFSRLLAVVVSTDIKSPASPCGMCRQFMREFLVSGDVLVVMMGSDNGDGGIVRRFEELLPMSFGPENLGIGR